MEIAWLHFAAGQIMHLVTEMHIYITHTYRARSLNLTHHWNQHQSHTLKLHSAPNYNTQPPFCTNTQAHTHTQSPGNEKKMEEKKAANPGASYCFKSNQSGLWWHDHVELNRERWEVAIKKFHCTNILTRFKIIKRSSPFSVPRLIINHRDVMKKGCMFSECVMMYWWVFPYRCLRNITDFQKLQQGNLTANWSELN